MVDVDLYKEYIMGMLDKCIHENMTKFVLYPNGEIAGLVKQVLNDRYNMSPVFIVDNFRYDQKNILNLEKAIQMTSNDMYYLVCSDNDSYYEDIRSRLRQYLRDEQIIDLFPDTKVNKERAYEILKELDEDIENMET